MLLGFGKVGILKREQSNSISVGNAHAYDFRASILRAFASGCFLLGSNGIIKWVKGDDLINWFADRPKPLRTNDPWFHSSDQGVYES